MSNALQEFDDHVRGFAESKELSDRDLLANFTIGLSGEAGEVTDALKKHLYHGDLFNRVNLIKEAGDLAWYWFALMQRLECDRILIARQTQLTLIEFADAPIVLPRSALYLSSETGRMSQVMLNHLFNEESLDRKEAQITMQCIFHILLCILKYFDIPLEVVLKANIEKLRSRHGGTAFNREAQRLNKALEESI